MYGLERPGEIGNTSSSALVERENWKSNWEGHFSCSGMIQQGYGAGTVLGSGKFIYRQDLALPG